MARSTRTKRWVLKRWRRGKRLAIVTLAGLLAFGGWQGYQWLTDPLRVRAVAMSVLQQTLGGRVYLGRAELDVWRGQLRLTDMQVSTLEDAGPSGRVIHAPQVNIRYGLKSILSGGEVVQSIEFPLATDLYLTRRPSGRWNIQDLRSGDESSSAMPRHWPQIELPELRLHLGETDEQAGSYRLVRRMDWSGRLFDPTPQPDGYRLEIRPRYSSDKVRDGGSEPALVSSIEGTIDLIRLSGSLVIRDLRWQPWMRLVLSPSMQATWDRLSPSGAISLLSVSFDSNRQPNWEAQLALDHLAADLPWDGPKLRLNLASGRVLLSGSCLTLEDIHARLADVGWFIKRASFDLQQPETSAWDLDFQAQGPLPRDQAIIDRLPERVSRYINRFSPRGDFSLSVQARSETDRPTQYRGQLKLIRVDGRDANFPYPFFGLNGSIDFDQDRLSLTDFQARGPTGASIFVRGWVEPMTDDAAASVMVVAEDLPLDEHLLSSLKPKARQLLEALMDHPSLAKRKSQGLVPADLTLGGQVNVTIMDGREVGLGKPFLTDIYLDTVNLTAMLSAWPAPVKLVGGQAHVHENRLMLHRVKLQGLTGGRGELSGTLEPMGDRLNPDLYWSMTDWPLDGLMVQAMPSSVRQTMSKLGLAGRLDVKGRYWQEETAAEESLTLSIDLSQGRMRPAGASPSKGLDIREIQGRIEISPHRATIARMTGRVDDSPLSLSGTLSWNDQLQVAGHGFRLAATNLAIDRPRLDSIRQMLGDQAMPSVWLNQADPVGTLDVAMDHWQTLGQAADYRLSLTPKTMSLTLNGQRLDYADLSGRLLLDSDWAILENLSARVDQANVRVSGRISLDEANRMDLTVDAQSPSLGREVGLLPVSVQAMLKSHAWQGGYSTQGVRVIQRPAGQGNGAGQTSVLAEIDLRRTQADLGVNISEFDGHLSLRALSLSDAPLPQLDVTIRGDRARVADRWVSPWSAQLTSSPEGLAYDLTDLQGDCYGGKVVGHGRLVPSSQEKMPGGFSIELALQDVALDPLLRPHHARRGVGPLRAASALSEKPASPASGQIGEGNRTEGEKPRVSDGESERGQEGGNEGGGGGFSESELGGNQWPDGIASRSWIVRDPSRPAL